MKTAKEIIYGNVDLMVDEILENHTTYQEALDFVSKRDPKLYPYESISNISNVVKAIITDRALAQEIKRPSDM